jgi:hypothetical protein
MAKKLLEEATVRRFMKIAGLQPLSEGFVDTLEEKKEEELKEEEDLKEEETVEEAQEADKADKADEAGEDKPMEENLDEMYKEEDPTPADDAPADEMPMDDEPEQEDDAELESALEKVLSALGYEVSLEDKEDDAEEMPMGDDEPEAPEALEESEHMEEPPADPAGTSLENLPLVDDADSKDPNQDPKKTEEEPMKDDGEHMAESKELKDKLVEQVAKRVAARLKKMK